MNGNVRNPEIELTMTIVPDRCARIADSTARVTCTAPKKLVSKTCPGIVIVVILDGTCAAEAGIVDEDIDTTLALEDLRDGILHRSGLATSSWIVSIVSRSACASARG